MTRSLRLVLLILFSSIHAQAIEAVVSHTIFYQPDKSGNSGNLRPYAEVSWQINPRSLHYVRSAISTLSSMVETTIVFSTDTGIVRQDRYILQTPPKATEAEVLALSITKLHRYGLPTGSFRMTLTLKDITDTTNHFNYTDTFTIADPGVSTYYSGIELLDTSFAATEENVFMKNDDIMLPLSTDFLDQNRTHLHFYFELYNTKSVAKDEYPLVQHTFISQREAESPFSRFSKYDTILPGQVVVPSLGEFKITTLGSGNYYLNTVLTNGLHRRIASRSVFFQRLNKNPEQLPEDTVKRMTKDIEDVTVLDLGKTFVARYDLAQVRAILKMMIPISDYNGMQTISGFLKKPEDLYMRYFIYNFFAAQNKKDPKAAWDAYADKVREVNRLFSNATNNGYETERGIIYLKYGKPTERIEVPNEAGANPYEIWVYDVLEQPGTGKKSGNAMFLFYKPADGIADYTLLHCTVPGEPKNPRWRNTLFVNSATMNAHASKAEEYIGNR